VPSPIKLDEIKRRRHSGVIYLLASGKRCFVAKRRLGDIIRDEKELSISEAIRSGSAAWGLDEATMVTLRLKEVELVSIKVKETKDVYLTTFERFSDWKCAKLRKVPGRGIMRCLPIAGNFAFRQGEVSM